jgi:hypothetical protein
MKAKKTGKPEVTALRTKLLASAKFKAAHKAALASRNERKRSTMCPDGKHDLKRPEHVHGGYLLREGGLLCRTCWIAKYARKPKTKGKVTAVWFPKPSTAKAKTA